MTLRLENVTEDDLLVIADVLAEVRADHEANGPSIIDERSEGECARVLDGTLVADLRRNISRLSAETEGDSR